MKADADDKLIDFAALRQVTFFAVRALGRHWLVSLLLLATMLTAAAGLYRWTPRSYRTRSTVSLSANPSLMAMVNPLRFSGRLGSPGPERAIQQTRSAAFLDELVDRFELVPQWDRTLTPLQRARDWVRSLAGLERTPEEQREILAETLKSRLYVTWNEKTSTVDIGIVWPDPVMGKALVEAAQERFLAAQREVEVEAATRASAVLEEGKAQASIALEEAITRVEAERARLRKGSKSSTVRGMQAQGRWRELPSAELSNLRTQILARRTAMSSLELQRQQRTATLESEVAELSARYGDEYPALQDARSRLDALRQESSDFIALRQDEQRLLREFVALGGRDIDLAESPRDAFPPELESEDPRLAHAREQLRLSAAHFAELTERLQTARLELAAAQAGFASYSVIRAPVVPADFERPTLKMAVVSGPFAGVLLALLAALYLDLRRGRLIEKWQVERALRVPVLAEVPRK